MQEHLKLLKDLSVLIVEDDEIARELLIGGLKPYCLSVWGAGDGLEGLEHFKKLAPAVVITDIHMPAMNGFEMMKEMMRIKPAQKFIVFTSYDTDDNLIKSIEHGAASFLKKPVDIAALCRLLVALTYEKGEKLVRLGPQTSINLAKEKIYKKRRGDLSIIFAKQALLALCVQSKQTRELRDDRGVRLRGRANE